MPPRAPFLPRHSGIVGYITTVWPVSWKGLKGLVVQPPSVQASGDHPEGSRREPQPARRLFR
jgi:hypothetical protein